MCIFEKHIYLYTIPLLCQNNGKRTVGYGQLTVDADYVIDKNGLKKIILSEY